MGSYWGFRFSAGKEAWYWSGPEGNFAPDQAGLSASLVNAVLGTAGLDWHRLCVPLSGAFKIQWGSMWGSMGGPDSLWARNPGAGVAWKGTLPLIRPGICFPS